MEGKRGSFFLVLDLLRGYLNGLGEDFMSGLESQASHWSLLMLWSNDLLTSQWVLGPRSLLDFDDTLAGILEHLMIVW